MVQLNGGSHVLLSGDRFPSLDPGAFSSTGREHQAEQPGSQRDFGWPWQTPAPGHVPVDLLVKLNFRGSWQWLAFAGMFDPCACRVHERARFRLAAARRPALQHLYWRGGGAAVGAGKRRLTPARPGAWSRTV